MVTFGTFPDNLVAQNTPVHNVPGVQDRLPLIYLNNYDGAADM